ncbi:MAG: hypothetical protein OQJ77_06880, partial [Thiovulaceae bacterium]|nr:hypothetical protein [Sulfurimonadaceae bacterium]
MNINYMRRISLQSALYLILTLVTGSVAGSVFEKMFMPGAVVEGHKKIEEQCSKCHVNFKQDAQKELCLDCHEKVSSDLRLKAGFHGKDRLANQSECRICHTDHIGRSADIVGLNKGRFNHQETDFELRDGHLGVACQECHQQGKAYRDALSLCIDCHKESDVHKGSLGKECTNCHATKRWDKTDFDHSKTEFQLIGKHQETACASCHSDHSYKQTPTLCIGCHSIDDKHQGTLGNKCETCHQESGWSKFSFSHDTDTKFP